MPNAENTVSLRDVIESDLPHFYEHQLDPEATEMAGFPSRERDAFMAHWAKNLPKETNTHRTILYNGQVAGNIVSYVMEGDTEIGYWIGKDFWGKGVASRALAEFLRQITVRPLYAHVVKHNIASVRVLQKCGFVINGENDEELILQLSL